MIQDAEALDHLILRESISRIPLLLGQTRLAGVELQECRVHSSGDPAISVAARCAPLGATGCPSLAGTLPGF